MSNTTERLEWIITAPRHFSDLSKKLAAHNIRLSHVTVRNTSSTCTGKSNFADGIIIIENTLCSWNGQHYPEEAILETVPYDRYDEWMNGYDEYLLMQRMDEKMDEFRRKTKKWGW